VAAVKSGRALDRRRLIRDLDATLADLRVGQWPKRAARYWRLRGFEQAVLVIRAAIVDGEYDVPRAKVNDPLADAGMQAMRQVLDEREGGERR
jgi:hypothetical protein